MRARLPTVAFGEGGPVRRSLRRASRVKVTAQVEAYMLRRIEICLPVERVSRQLSMPPSLVPPPAGPYAGA